MAPSSRLSFGITGNAVDYQRGGWSIAEHGFTWTIGDRSQIDLPVPSGGGVLFLEMQVVPFLAAPHRTGLTLAVTAGGIRLGREHLTGPTRLAFRVPPHALDGTRRLPVTLVHADAAAPADFGQGEDRRRLGVAVQEMRLDWVKPGRPVTTETRAPLPLGPPAHWDEAVTAATGKPLNAVLQSFQSLGHNCEFGLMQRALGVDPLGLLRFAAISPENLLRGLEENFSGIEAGGNLSLYVGQFNGRDEFLLRDAQYGIEMHTGHFVDTATPDEVRQKLTPYLARLREHFTGHIQARDSIFVVHHPSISNTRRALPLRNRLAGNALLYVTADPALPPGSVVRERANLLRGYIDRLVPMQTAHMSNLRAWVSLCANAVMLTGVEDK